MAIKGAESKEYVKNKIFEVFENDAFMNGKEIRICCVENNEPVEVKITLTAAKDCVKGSDSTITGATQAQSQNTIEPTKEEIERLNILLNKIG